MNYRSTPIFWLDVIAGDYTRVEACLGMGMGVVLGYEWEQHIL